MKGAGLGKGNVVSMGLRVVRGRKECASVAGTIPTLLSFSETLSPGSTAPYFSKAGSSFLIEKPSFNF